MKTAVYDEVPWTIYRDPYMLPPGLYTTIEMMMNSKWNVRFLLTRVQRFHVSHKH